MKIKFTEEQICHLEDCIINKLSYPLWIAKEGVNRVIRKEEFITAEQKLNEIIKFLRGLRN